MSNTQLNNGRALRVIVSILALYVSTRTSTEVAASKKLLVQCSGIEEHYQQVL